MLESTISTVNYTELMAALKIIFNNPWMLVFASLFILGYYFKEYTKVSNKLIPLILLVAGGILGFFFIAKAFAGVVIGLIMAFVVIAFYETIKNTIQYFVIKKTNTGA